MEDTETSDSFAERISQVVSHSFVTLGLNIGSKLKLFDLMATFNEPKTAGEIAQAGGFKEGYIREWLGLMVCSKVVDIDPEGTKFFLPSHRRSSLTGHANIAKSSELTAILGKAQPDVMECLKNDGPNGIPYSKYPDMLDWLDDMASLDFCSTMRKIQPIHDLLEQGAQVAELGSSSGMITQQLAIGYPKSCFIGMDIAEDAIVKGKARIEELDLTNISMIVQDILKMPSDWSNKWDCVILYDVAHDVPFTQHLFREVYRVLKQNGLLLLIDIDLHSNIAHNLKNPMSPLLYCGSLHHCKPISLSVDGAEGWGATWGKETAVKLVEKAGFKDVDIKYSRGINFYCTGRKDSK